MKAEQKEKSLLIRLTESDLENLDHAYADAVAKLGKPLSRSEFIRCALRAYYEAMKEKYEAMKEEA